MPEALEFERVEREPVAAPEARARPDVRAAAVIVANIAAYYGILWVEPAAPHHSATVWVAIAIVLELAFFSLAFAGSYLALKQRARLGFSLLFAATCVQMVAVIGCPVSGHHPFGGWWMAQLAMAGAAMVVNWVAMLNRRSPVQRRADA